MSIPAAEYDLPDDQLRVMWPGLRAPIFADTARSPRPLVVFVGAQPGAGKTRTIGRVEAWNPDRDFVLLDSDALRKAHPKSDEIMQRDPTRMPVLTNQAASAWLRMGIAEARAGGYDVIIENTLHNPDDVLAEAGRFAGDGYRVEAVVLAVPEADSRLGTVGRYFAALNEGDPARWTNNASHDRGYTGAPTTVAALEAATDVDRVVITDRQGTVHYDTQAPANTDPSAAAALQRVRSFRKTPEALTEWVTRWRALQQMAANYGIQDDPSVAAVFQRLDTDAAALINRQKPLGARAPADSALSPLSQRLQAIANESRSRARAQHARSESGELDPPYLRSADGLAEEMLDDRSNEPRRDLRP